VSPPAPDAERTTIDPGANHLSITFTPDHRFDFYPTTDNPPDLARRFADLVRLLVGDPTLIRRVAGTHTEACACPL
jgi:hypothetical protein